MDPKENESNWAQACRLFGLDWPQRTPAITSTELSGEVAADRSFSEGISDRSNRASQPASADET